MRTLVYKRTHRGDPDVDGCFGINDCMHSVRAWDYEAVIGVGGIGSKPEAHGIARKINWIGIGPRKRPSPTSDWPLVTFDHFLFYGSEGPLFADLAPRLATRMYDRNVRKVMDSLDTFELEEIERILDQARNAPPSPADQLAKPKHGDVCTPREQAKKPGCPRPALHASSDCKPRRSPVRDC
jgi:hypothetical protein